MGRIRCRLAGGQSGSNKTASEGKKLLRLSVVEAVRELDALDVKQSVLRGRSREGLDCSIVRYLVAREERRLHNDVVSTISVDRVRSRCECEGVVATESRLEERLYL